MCVLTLLMIFQSMRYTLIGLDNQKQQEKQREREEQRKIKNERKEQKHEAKPIHIDTKMLQDLLHKEASDTDNFKDQFMEGKDVQQVATALAKHLEEASIFVIGQEVPCNTIPWRQSYHSLLLTCDPNHERTKPYYSCVTGPGVIGGVTNTHQCHQ